MTRSGHMAVGTKQAEQLRQDGNAFFKKDRFSAAIDAYTKAIILCSNVPVYWINRALWHRRHNDWVRVEEDSRRAIQLDQKAVKARYMLGLALLQKENYRDGVKELEKALDLGRGANPKSYMVEEIWQELARGKYLLWKEESTQRFWEQQTLKEFCVSALQEKHKHLRAFLQSEEYLKVVAGQNSAQLEALERVFSTATEADVPTEVPDYLCCKVTLDIFRDPVITPSGITYERAVILNHLEKVGKFDPTTRQSLVESELIPNLAIKEAVQAFLGKHGWAYKTDQYIYH